MAGPPLMRRSRRTASPHVSTPRSPGSTLGDPSRLWLWEAPFFQLLMLSYTPNRAVLAWPQEQSLTTPLGRIEIASERMTASVRFAPTPSLPLDAFTAGGDGAAPARSDAGLAHRRLRDCVLPPNACRRLANGQSVGVLGDRPAPARGGARRCRPRRGTMPPAFERLAARRRHRLRRVVGSEPRRARAPAPYRRRAARGARGLGRARPFGLGRADHRAGRGARGAHRSAA